MSPGLISGSSNLVFTSDASTNANNRDDPSENEIRRKHKHKQNHPNIPNCLLGREVIWIQCFHWPNTTTCGKYPCACVIPERYFNFTCCSVDASISASTRKRKQFDSCPSGVLAVVLMPALRPFSRWNKNYCVCASACVCACVASENQAFTRTSISKVILWQR